MKCTSFLSDRENIILQWALKLNSALATEETWDLKGCMLKVSVGTLGYQVSSVFLSDGVHT